MGRANDRRAADQTVGKRLRHGVRLRRARLGGEFGVFGDQLNMVADLFENRHVAAAHLAGIQTALAKAALDIHGKEKRRVELLGFDLQPDFFILSVQGEKSLDFFRAFDHLLKRL